MQKDLSYILNYYSVHNRCITSDAVQNALLKIEDRTFTYIFNGFSWFHDTHINYYLISVLDLILELNYAKSNARYA